MKLICPVSGTENEDREECKQCGTDLRPLIRVSEFPREFFEGGTQSLAKGQLTEAVEQFSTAAALDADSADIHLKLAEAFTRLGLRQSALSHLDRAASLAPDRGDVQDAREALLRTEREAETNTHLQRARQQTQRFLLRYLPAGSLLLGIVLVLTVQKTVQWRRPRPDVTSIVQRCLDANSETNGLQLRVNESEGTMQIVGEVPSELHRELVSAVARGCDAAVTVDIARLSVRPPVPQPSPKTYRVRPGDTWWTIASRKYANALVWPQLEQLNRKQEVSSRYLKVGQNVTLPPITFVPR